MDYETAFSIAITSDFRSICQQVSSGTNVSYRNDETGIWYLRYIDVPNNNCSIGVFLPDGGIYWFDCYFYSGKYSSDFRIYDITGETIRLTVFDGQTTTNYDGEP